MALSAQTPPQQPTVMPKAPVVLPKSKATLRQLGDNPEKMAVCSIPLLEVLVAKNQEPMPVLLPPADNIDNIPVNVPAPPCNEEKR
jgi:hypothetical protein